MTTTIIDPSLYCQFEDEQLVGINGGYVDNFPRAETDEWQTHSHATLERLENNREQQAPCTFAGMNITEYDNMYCFNQDLYTSKI